ncbi:oligosaccharyl transferase subunit [Niveomyces insectorum RCEF 264]|uniref:Dolichyl-diphosphooligosaccharide--protein glycosyltransferase subunit 1 n=1 Tax=Niveomyces insectorum RCEF 264 TaxID=1081102 RepID=A0A167MGJ8_9HYPO|nr:oligosaccharyl transferase subunit [Niveomyces insectorum RCEF 264]
MRLFSPALPALLLALTSSLSTVGAATFVPPAVFKNANLVHVVSVEKNYVKETINVLVENIDSSPQDEYYLPFATDKFAHVGGLEVKDRKDSHAGPFAVDAVEIDGDSDVQYYRVHLPAPLKAGAQQTLGITYYVLRAYRPLPATIAQDDKQYLVYKFSAYCPSAYDTDKQKTEVKFPTSDIPDYTKLPAGSGSEGDKPQPQKQGAKLTYGPFGAQPAGAALPVEVRFEFTKPVTHVTRLERDVEVSHWGGNVAFEERYALRNVGAELATLFNRVKWAQAQYYRPATPALTELRVPLRAGSADAYYTDVIGNVSTSRFRPSARSEALLEIKPRYPVFGGWQFPFTIGWNGEARQFLRKVTTGSSSGRSFVLNVPFLEGPRQTEGVAYEQVRLQILLPEGAENVKYYASIPPSVIKASGLTLHKTYLDTVGRTAVVIEAENLVDEFRDREVVVTYDYPLLASLRKPLVVFGSTLSLFIAAWLIGNVELKFSKK